MSSRKGNRKQTAVRVMALFLAAVMALSVGVYIFILIGGGF